MNQKLINNQNIKILVIVPKYSFSLKPDYGYIFPLNIGYITSVLMKENFNVDVINLNHQSGTIKEILTKSLNKKKYDFVCTGGMATSYPVLELIFEAIRSHESNPKIIIGGLVLSSQKELIAKNLDFDYGVIDEGEETIIELINSIKNNSNLNNVKGIVYFNDKKPKFTEERAPPKNLDKIPFPELDALGYNEWLNNQICNSSYVNSIFDKPRVYQFLGSRSCPFNCTFCYHYNRNYRQRSIKNMMEELNYVVKKYKINILFIHDECFALDEKRLKEFCKKIKKLRGEISWDLKWIPSFRVSCATDKVLEILKDAGCYVIAYGFESYSPTVLKSMNKNITPEQIDNAIKKTLEKGIGLEGVFIFGDVAETKETAAETLNYWKKNCNGQINLSFIRPYPKSEIYLSCVKRGIIKNEINFIKSLMGKGEFVINFTKNIPNKEFEKLKEEVYAALSKYRRISVPKSIKKTGKNYYDLTIKCPYCGKVMKYGSCYIENIFSYSFNAKCRNCPMRFYVASSLRKLALRNYNLGKKAKDIKIKIQNYLEKIKQ